MAELDLIYQQLAAERLLVRDPGGPVPIFGIDISRYQAGIDLAQVAREGFAFVIAKVTQGSRYRSSAWPGQRDAARANGLHLAGYHYIDTTDPAAQAANCRAHLGDPSIPVMLDWENDGGEWANFRRVLAAFRAAGLDVRLAYVPGWYHAQHGAPDLTGTGLALVSSRYPSYATGPASVIYEQVGGRTWTGYGGLNPTILQFTDRASVAGLQVDANAFLGSREQLAELFGTAGPVTTLAPPRVREDVDMYIKCKPDPGKPDMVAILSGPFFVQIASPGEVKDAERAMAAGAPWQWVEPATWLEFDRRSHAICDNPRPVSLPTITSPTTFIAATKGWTP